MGPPGFEPESQAPKAQRIDQATLRSHLIQTRCITIHHTLPILYLIVYKCYGLHDFKKNATIICVPKNTK